MPRQQATCHVIKTNWPRAKYSRLVYPVERSVPCLFGGLEIVVYNSGPFTKRQDVEMPCSGCLGEMSERCLRRHEKTPPFEECSSVWINPANLCELQPEEESNL